MLRLNSLTPLLALLPLALASCESQSNYRPPKPGPDLTEAEWKTKINMSNAVWQMVSVTEVLEAYQNDLLRVQIHLKNRTQGRQSFRTLVEWYDADGFKIDSPNDGWMSHVIRAGQQFSVDANAVHPKAADWRLNVVTWAR